jgi:hypothetical protein
VSLSVTAACSQTPHNSTPSTCPDRRADLDVLKPRAVPQHDPLQRITLQPHALESGRGDELDLSHGAFRWQIEVVHLTIPEHDQRLAQKRHPVLQIVIDATSRERPEFFPRGGQRKFTVLPAGIQRGHRAVDVEARRTIAGIHMDYGAVAPCGQHDSPQFRAARNRQGQSGAAGREIEKAQVRAAHEFEAAHPRVGQSQDVAGVAAHGNAALAIRRRDQRDRGTLAILVFR